MSHRALYAVPPNPASLIDLLARDGRNPRSILFHLRVIQTHIEALPAPAIPSDVVDQAKALPMMLDQSSAAEFDPDELLKLRDQIWALSNALSAAYLK